jgi:hypothetical protein
MHSGILVRLSISDKHIPILMKARVTGKLRNSIIVPHAAPCHIRV